MRCVPRESSLLRCAFCHDDVAAPSWACERCRTRLHADCFGLLSACPTLGCAPRGRVLVLPRTRDRDAATAWDLGVWLTTFAGVWASLAWLAPRITKIYEKKKQSFPMPTTWVMDLLDFSHSWLGVLTALAIVAASIYAFVKHRERRAVTWSFVALTTCGFAFFPAAGFAIILALVNMPHRL